MPEVEATPSKTTYDGFTPYNINSQNVEMLYENITVNLSKVSRVNVEYVMKNIRKSNITLKILLFSKTKNLEASNIRINGTNYPFSIDYSNVAIDFETINETFNDDGNFRPIIVTIYFQPNETKNLTIEYYSSTLGWDENISWLDFHYYTRSRQTWNSSINFVGIEFKINKSIVQGSIEKYDFDGYKIESENNQYVFSKCMVNQTYNDTINFSITISNDQNEQKKNGLLLGIIIVVIVIIIILFFTFLFYKYKRKLK